MSANNSKVLCFIIHGIGPQEPNFSVPLREGIQRQLQKLEPNLGARAEFYNLYWADKGFDQQDNLYRSIYPDSYVKGGALKTVLQFIENLGPVRSVTFRLIGDVFKYLGRYQKPIKETVVQQFAAVLKEKQASGESFSLVLVGHSLGTVILHDLISAFLEYKYEAFEKLVNATSVFSMGSPISFFSLVAETVDPSRFRRWTNFVNPKDPIAFPMANRTTAVLDVAVSPSSFNPISNHSGYWEDEKVHKYVAEEIQSHINNSVSVLLEETDLTKEIPPEIYQPFQTAATKVGFSQYIPNFNRVPFEALFSTGKRIDICLLYGGSWFGVNGQYMERALERADTDIRICLLSPKSAFVPGIKYQFNEKTNKGIAERARKATEGFMGAFQTAAKTSKTPGRLRIYHSLNGINHSFYRFDDLIYFAPRQMTTNKQAATPIPTMVFRGQYPPQRKQEAGYDMYSWLMRDFELLLAETREATLFFDSKSS